MIQSQSKAVRQQHCITISGRNHLLRRHPVLTPVVLLGGSALLGIASLFTDAVFPVLALLGESSTPLCLSMALVLGISGILIGIISIIEYVDRHSTPAAMLSKPKEHSYAN
jgi:hypothetical protein